MSRLALPILLAWSSCAVAGPSPAALEPAPTPAPEPAPTAPVAVHALAAPPAQAQERVDAQPTEAGARATVAARVREHELTFERLDEVVLLRYGFNDTGREALEHLAQTRLLELLAAEAGLEVPARDVDASIRQLERELVQTGTAKSLAQFLESEGVSMPIFRKNMELGLVHERLARRALGVPEDRPLTGEQQTLWLKGELEARNYRSFTPPWKDGIVARADGFVLREAEFSPHLRSQVEREELEELCYTILLAERMRERMPDLSDEAMASAVEAEIERRRREAEAKQKYADLTYEALLAAAGLTLEGMRRDPAVHVAALSKTWIDRSYTEADIEQTYQSDREYYDSRFGEGIEVSVLFLRGAEFTNELNPRTLKEADAILERVAKGLRTREDFLAQVEALTDDAKLKRREGRLGFVTRTDPRVAVTIRSAVWEAVDSGRWPGPEGSGKKAMAEHRLAGPVRTSGGSVLIWMGERRPAPNWPTMQFNVQQELRRRFIEECLPRRDLVTYLTGAG